VSAADSAHGLQGAIAHLIVSSDTTLLADPDLRVDTLATKFGLTYEDRRTLRRVADARLVQFGTALRRKRVENLAYVFTRTLRHLDRLDGGLDRTVEAFWRECPPRPSSVVHAYLESAAGFRDLIVRWPRGDAPWLPDLATAEYALAELRFTADSSIEPPAEPQPSERRYEISPAVRLLRLSWNVLAGATNEEFAEPERFWPDRHVVLHRRSEGGVTALAISRSTFDLMEACCSGARGHDQLEQFWASGAGTLASKVTELCERELLVVRC